NSPRTRRCGWCAATRGRSGLALRLCELSAWALSSGGLWRPRSSGVLLHLRLHPLHLDLHVDPVGDQDAARLEGLVPGEAELAAIDPRLGAERQPLDAERILHAAEELRVQLHLPGRPADGQVADQSIPILSGLLHALAPESDG